jgi:hypothetical protein
MVSMKNLFVVTVLMILTVGCGIGKPLRLQDTPLAQKTAAFTEPLDYIIAVVPPKIAYDPEAETVEGRGKFAEIPQEVLQNTMIGALKQFPIFTEVLSIAPAELVNEPRAIAKDRGADLLLRSTLREVRVQYLGRGWLLLAKIPVFLVSEFLSALIADERYSAKLVVDATIESTYNGHILCSRQFAVDIKAKLDDYQRGFKIYGIMRVPYALNDKNYKKVSDVLVPHALAQLQRELLVDVLEKLVPQMQSEDFNEKIGRPRPEERVVPASAKLALVFGVNKCNDPKIPVLKYAEADAISFAAKLKEVGFDPASIVLATGKDVRKESILGRLRALKTPGSPQRRLLVLYFAGCGVSRQVGNSARFYLLPRDTNSGDLKNTAIDLEEIAAILQALDIPNVVVFVDAGFAGGRALHPGSRVSQFPKSLSKKNVTFMFTATPEQVVNERAALGHGLGTYYLLEAFSSWADADGNGMLTLTELAAYAQSELERQSRALGSTQTLTTVGPTNIPLGSMKR